MGKRNMIRIEGTAEALEPIIHGGERTGGIVTEFHREKVRVGDHFEYLPMVSANAIAGILRDQCAFWCLDQIEFDRFEDLRMFDLLTGGGMLTSAGNAKYVDLFEENELRELFPVISLLGASVGNRILGGRLDVARWVPVCVELKSALPEELWEMAERWHVEDLLQEMYFTRRDDKKNRDWQMYIEPETLAGWQREQASRAEKGEGNRAGAPMSMRYGYEALAQGTMFAVGFTLRNPTEVELGVFFGGLGYFYERPKIGGRGSRGFGKVRLDLQQYQLVGPGKVKHPLAVESVEAAREHLLERKVQIEQALRSAL